MHTILMLALSLKQLIRRSPRRLSVVSMALTRWRPLSNLVIRLTRPNRTLIIGLNFSA